MKLLKAIPILLVVIGGVLTSEVWAAEGNFLDPARYSFEDAGSSTYYQQSQNYWSVSSEKSTEGGTYSLKFSSSAAVTGTEKAKNGGISLPAGEYTFKVMVWKTADAEINGFSFNIKNPWKSIQVNTQDIEREKWVEISIPLTLGASDNSDCIIRMDAIHIGNGTMYLDDFGFWGEKGVAPVMLDLVSKTETSNENALNLAAGVYTLQLDLFKESGTSISKISTSISEPFKNLFWDLNGVSEDTWTTVSQEVIFPDSVADASFALQVNNFPSAGGGIGNVYIDEVQFIKQSDYVKVEGISISEATIEMFKNETFALQSQIQPVEATNKKVSWVSSNPSIVSVNDVGELKALAGGEALISVFSNEGYFVARCAVSVTVPVEDITLSHTEITIKTGEEFELTDTIKPLDASNKNVEWSSASDAIATVSSGTVKGVSVGQTVVQVTSEDGDFSATCVVNVEDDVAIGNINQQHIDILPNPFNEQIKLRFRAYTFETLELYSLSGRKVWSSIIRGQNEVTLSPSYATLPAGMYLLQLKGANGSTTLRVVRN